MTTDPDELLLTYASESAGYWRAMLERAWSAAWRCPSPVNVASVMPQFALESPRAAGARVLGAAAAGTEGAAAMGAAAGVRAAAGAAASGADDRDAAGVAAAVRAGVAAAVDAAFVPAVAVAVADRAGAEAPARLVLAGWISDASPPVDHWGAFGRVRTRVGGSSIGSSNCSELGSLDADIAPPLEGAGSGPQA